MRDEKVAVFSLPIERRARVADTGEAGECELNKKGDAKKHRHVKPDAPADHSGAPVQYFHAGRDCDQHGRDNEEQIHRPAHADREHMMAPHERAQHHDGDRGSSDKLVTEDRFT